jgi:hypothetical protein
MKVTISSVTTAAGAGAWLLFVAAGLLFAEVPVAAGDATFFVAATGILAATVVLEEAAAGFDTFDKGVDDLLLLGEEAAGLGGILAINTRKFTEMPKVAFPQLRTLEWLESVDLTQQGGLSLMRGRPEPASKFTNVIFWDG